MDEVYLLYEGDEWLSTENLVLMGIFTTTDILLHFAEELIKQRLPEHYETAISEIDDEMTEEEVLGCIMEELRHKGSTNGWDCNYIVKEVELNVLEEL